MKSNTYIPRSSSEPILLWRQDLYLQRCPKLQCSYERAVGHHISRQLKKIDYQAHKLRSSSLHDSMMVQSGRWSLVAHLRYMWLGEWIWPADKNDCLRNLYRDEHLKHLVADFDMCRRPVKLTSEQTYIIAIIILLLIWRNLLEMFIQMTVGCMICDPSSTTLWHIPLSRWFTNAETWHAWYEHGLTHQLMCPHMLRSASMKLHQIPQLLNITLLARGTKKGVIIIFILSLHWSLVKSGIIGSRPSTNLPLTCWFVGLNTNACGTMVILKSFFQDKFLMS